MSRRIFLALLAANPLDTVFDATVNLVNQSGGSISWRPEAMKVHGPVPHR